MATSPIIILVSPQLVENIGTTARAMMNCGLTDLRLVNPRDPWPLGETHATRMKNAASGADPVLDRATVYSTVDAATSDITMLYATTARPHDMVNRILTARAAGEDMVGRIRDGNRVGVMFGPERTGLFGDDVARAHARITIPLNPEFSSLNLAQAVLLIAYEWRQATDTTPPEQLRTGRSRPATQDEYLNLFHRLTAALDTNGFFTAEKMRPSMIRSLQSMFQRAEMTEQEVRTWHGVITALAGPRGRPKPSAEETS